MDIEDLKPVKHFSPSKMSVSQLVSQFRDMGFNARKLALAVDVCEEMIRDKDCVVFLGLAGAMVPAGLRRTVVEMIRNKWVDVLVTTGANLTHDLIEAFGGCHYQGSPLVDDAVLKEQGINRIYDIFLPNKFFGILEEKFQPILKELSGKKYPVKEFLKEVGGRIEDKDSIIRSCFEINVDLYCPAISDSGVGLQLWFFLQKNDDITVDTFSDLKDIINMVWEAERTGTLLIGGGVPKNFILQAAQATSKEHEYAVQITLDREETGGLSGAKLKEGISWGKIDQKAKYVDLICDATIALPIIVSALKERISNNP
ncbi:MAG: deoxyhypusine synthase [Candidatus Wukongarchaeota archaeon]|nr:deoxyhypusine synthase [Candidatus Wukongarchaeota archaeon]